MINSTILSNCFNTVIIIQSHIEKIIVQADDEHRLAGAALAAAAALMRKVIAGAHEVAFSVSIATTWATYPPRRLCYLPIIGYSHGCCRCCSLDASIRSNFSNLFQMLFLLGQGFRFHTGINNQSQNSNDI
jgi:hypothetical protein